MSCSKMSPCPHYPYTFQHVCIRHYIVVRGKKNGRGGEEKKKSKGRPIKLVRYVNLSLQAVAHYDGLIVAYTIFSIRLVHC